MFSHEMNTDDLKYIEEIARMPRMLW
jgi:hypothetical protein